MRGYRETFSFRAHPRVPGAPPGFRFGPVTRGMDSFELNKIAGAVLFTILVILSLGIVAEVIYGPHKPEKPGFEIAVAEAPEGGPSTGGGAATVEPIAVRLASADVGKGEATAKKCLACHTLGQGEPAKVGPNLYNVVGAPFGHLAGFAYSEAILKKKAEGGTWTFENLDHFLANPKAFIPGTKMTFVGVKKDDERADVIDYLRTLSPNPMPLPSPTADATPAAPAESGAPAAAPAAPAETPAAPAPAEPEPVH